MYGELQSIMSSLPSGGSFSSVFGVVGIIAKIFVIVGFGLSIVSLAFSFIQFASSAGDKDALDKAKNSFLWGGIGAFIALLSYTVVSIITKLIS